MTATKVLVIYSKAQKVMRRLVICEQDDHYKSHIETAHEKEGLLEIPLDLYNTFDAEKLARYVEDEIGKSTGDECVVICPYGTTKAFIHADPEIDYHPDGEIKYLKDIK